MSADYTLPDILERIYDNPLNAAAMELKLWVEQNVSSEVG